MIRNKKFEFLANKGGRKHKKMKIFFSEIDRGFEPDPFCLSLWDATMPSWISNELHEEMVDALRGFDKDMALEIADNLIDFWSGLGLHLTGIKHVDELLGKLYMRILDCAHRQGITLKRGM